MSDQRTNYSNNLDLFSVDLAPPSAMSQSVLAKQLGAASKSARPAPRKKLSAPVQRSLFDVIHDVPALEVDRKSSAERMPLRAKAAPTAQMGLFDLGNVRSELSSGAPADIITSGDVDLKNETPSIATPLLQKEDHAGTLQTEPIPAGPAGEFAVDVGTGDRNSQPLVDRLASDRAGADLIGGVSPDLAGTGRTGTGGADRPGSAAPGAPRDHAVARPESESTERVTYPQKNVAATVANQEGEEDEAALLQRFNLPVQSLPQVFGEAALRQSFISSAGVGKIIAAKTKYTSGYGVSWASTDIASADSMAEAIAIARAVADSGAAAIQDMRAVAANWIGAMHGQNGMVDAPLPQEDISPSPSDATTEPKAEPATRQADTAIKKYALRPAYATKQAATMAMLRRGLGVTHKVKPAGDQWEVVERKAEEPATVADDKVSVPEQRLLNAQWRDSTPAERRELLRQAGYTDADQTRVLSGTDWTDLTNPVRRALSAAQVAFITTQEAVSVQDLAPQPSAEGANLRDPYIDAKAEPNESPSASDDAAEARKREFKTQVDAAWERALEGEREFILHKMYPAEVTVNGKTIRFGVSKDSSAGPKKLTMISQTRLGPQFDHFKMRFDGQIEKIGQQNLWAMTEEARNLHIEQFNAMFEAAEPLKTRSEPVSPTPESATDGDRTVAADDATQANSGAVGSTQASAADIELAETLPGSTVVPESAVTGDAPMRDNQGRDLAAVKRHVEYLQAMAESGREASAKAFAAKVEQTPLANWVTINDVRVLRCGDSKYVAVPVSGQESSVSFNILDLEAGSFVVDLHRDEVRNWLWRTAQIEQEARLEAEQVPVPGPDEKAGQMAMPDESAVAAAPVPHASATVPSATDRTETIVVENLSDTSPVDGDENVNGAEKFRRNVAAIRLLKELEVESRTLTAHERKTLARYSGWGSLKSAFEPANESSRSQYETLLALLSEEEFKSARKSTLDAFYTPNLIIRTMYDALDQVGFDAGRIAEPALGIGKFFELMPAHMRASSALHGVELDDMTSRIAAALHPRADIRKATGFEDYSVPSEYFDLVIGNPPFGSQPLVDMDRTPYSGFSIHNYFLSKSIDKLRPGGIMLVVVSHSFLDGNDNRARKWIAERAGLIGAVRLPNNAFGDTEVVTDILLYQRKAEGLDVKDIAPWVDVATQRNVNPKTGDTVEHRVSRVFIDHPQLVLGKPSAAGSMYSGDTYTVEPDGDLALQLSTWVQSLPNAVYTPLQRENEDSSLAVNAPEWVKVGSYFVSDTDQVMIRLPDRMGKSVAVTWEPPNQSSIDRMKGMIDLRDLLRKQMSLERSLDATEEQVETSRSTLNKRYDTFVAKYGHINNQTNRRLFLDDTEAQLLQALEFDFDRGISRAVAEKEGLEPRGPSAIKADILSRRVAFPPQEYLSVETAKDALLASLDLRGHVDISYMTAIYQKPAAEIIEELGDVVYEDPQSGLIVTADDYLSGDVKTKLEFAKTAALDNEKFQRNVQSLLKIIPEDKRPSQIFVSIGAGFVPTDIYQAFIEHITGAKAEVGYVQATGHWLVSYSGTPDQTLNTSKFGTSSINAQQLLGLSLAGRGAVVKKTVQNPDGTSRSVVMEQETEQARAKQDEIKAEWKSWLWSDPDRSNRIATIYNDTMNRTVVRRYDGLHMSFPGKNPAINLRDQQKNGVWRGLQSRQVLYDHVVGAGKTFAMAALAMEMRRLGIARKPLFVVPNHLTLQWRGEFNRLYPGANILAATPDDFAKDNRERMFAKIVTGDWDAVIVGHSSLAKIGLPEETEKAVLQEQIDDLADAIEEIKRGRGDRHILKDMERIRANLEAKMKTKLHAAGKRDKVVSFDELGIDAMFIDEMHEFKNLMYHSSMDRAPGMGNPAGSNKAFDLFVKIRWLFETFGEKAPLITATGTPVSNSLVEMFNMQRYMQYDSLKSKGLHVFDAWAKQFGSIENVYEVAPSGSGYRQSTRFAKFSNLPALMSFYQSFADIVTLDDLKAQEQRLGRRFPVPNLVGGKPLNIVAERSPEVANLMGVPRAMEDDAGNIMFRVDLTVPVEFKQQEKTGQYLVHNGNNAFGPFETEAEARLAIVERALAPVVTVDPLSILGRFGRLRELNRETKGKVNALSLTNEANKAGLDYRLIDPAAPDFAGSKLNLAVDQMMSLYEKWHDDRGTQLVFCDQSIPLSAKASLASTESRVYVRSDDGLSLALKRGTLHAPEREDGVPFIIIARGDKESRRFDVFDAASGVLVLRNKRSKAEARDDANAMLADPAYRERWLIASDEAGAIDQDLIDAYNEEMEIETEGLTYITPDYIASAGGAAGFSVYDDLKAKLMARGVPEREIAFMHDFSTPSAKAKLFRAVNIGDIRFLFGSTALMGAGTNVQQRVVGVHHIDAPWRPSDLEQREGRAIRQGNLLYQRDPDGFEVLIARYATAQTYDTRRWQLLEHKARGIEQLRKYDGVALEIDDVTGGESANAADIKAAASGDPLILEETRLRTELRRLETLQAAHNDEKLPLERNARRAEKFATDDGPRRLARIEQCLADVAQHPVQKGELGHCVVDGRVYDERESAAEALAQAFADLQENRRRDVVIEFRGLSFEIERNEYGINADGPFGDLGSWSDASSSFSAYGLLQRMANYIERLTPMRAATITEIERARHDAVALREQARQPFAHTTELETSRAAHVKIRRALLTKGPDVPPEQKAKVDAAIAEQKRLLLSLGFGDALREITRGSVDATPAAGEVHAEELASEPNEPTCAGHEPERDADVAECQSTDVLPVAGSEAGADDDLMDLLAPCGKSRIGHEVGRFVPNGVSVYISTSCSFRYVLSQDGQPLAVVHLVAKPGDESAQILHVFTAPSQRHKDYASFLLARAQKDFPTSLPKAVVAAPSAGVPATPQRPQGDDSAFLGEAADKLISTFGDTAPLSEQAAFVNHVVANARQSPSVMALMEGGTQDGSLKRALRGVVQQCVVRAQSAHPMLAAVLLEPDGSNMAEFMGLVLTCIENRKDIDSDALNSWDAPQFAETFSAI